MTGLLTRRDGRRVRKLAEVGDHGDDARAVLAHVRGRDLADAHHARQLGVAPVELVRIRLGGELLRAGVRRAHSAITPSTTIPGQQ